MGATVEDMHWQDDVSDNYLRRCTDHPSVDANHIRQRRQRGTWSSSSDYTGYSIRTGSTQPEDEHCQDSCNEGESSGNSLTSDEAWSLQSNPHSSLSVEPIQSDEQRTYPNQDQPDYETLIQSSLIARSNRKSTEAQETMSDDVYAPFELSREQNHILAKTGLGSSEDLLQDPTNETRLKQSGLDSQQSPSLSTLVPKDMSLSLSLKRPPLPLKPLQSRPDQTWPTKARSNHQLSLVTTNHQERTQTYQNSKNTQVKDKPLLPPKPKNSHLKSVPQTKQINADFPPPRPPKPKLEQVLPPEPTQNTQQPLIPPKPANRNNHQQKPAQRNDPPKLPSRNDQQQNPASRNFDQRNPTPPLPPPIQSRIPTPRQLPLMQAHTETQISFSVSHQVHHTTPSVSTSSEETTESSTSYSPQSLASNNNAYTQHLRRSKRRPHCLLNKRNMLIASLVSILMSLAALSFLACIELNIFSFTWRDLTFREGAYKTCVKCMSLIQDLSTDLSNLEFQNLVNEPRDGEMYCCATNSKQISSLLKLILRQQEYKPSKPINSKLPGSSVVASAHMQLNKSDVKSNIIGDGHTIMIINQNKSSEHHKKVTVDKYGLKIEISGYYYVYSSIFYSYCATEDSKHLEHTIFLVRPTNTSDNGILAKTAYTCRQGDKQSSFAGGVFKLMERDQVATSVTDVNAVQFDDSSYFGVVMLGTLMNE